LLHEGVDALDNLDQNSGYLKPFGEKAASGLEIFFLPVAASLG
tara:strand:+ start:170 stop:298 length:129 start_codon:yes stop_codon:yes gene_type:complete